MITFSRFGQKGGLGNQLFQFASLVGIAKRRNFDWSLPVELDSGKKVELLELFSVPDIWEQALPASQLKFPKFNSRPNRFLDTTGVRYDQKLHNQIPDNHDIDAYLQSEKYFHDCSEYLRGQLTIRSERKVNLPQFNQNYIALHIRRQDYIKARHTHRVLPVSYYKAALKKLPDLPILIFSDDHNWVRSEKFFLSESMSLMEGDLFSDFQGIMGSKYAVIANSSFSWWAAWLSRAEKVLAPNRWFGWSYPRAAGKDLIPDRWIVI